MSAYRKDFDATKYVYFLIKIELFAKCNEIWEKYNNIKNELESEPA